MTTPAVSVVIPTRDRADLLALTLRTVLAQRGVVLEVLVVDDGDGPGTAALLDRVSDRRVRLIRHAGTRGEGGARNAGIEAARFEWIAFCDDDDLWAPGKLAWQLAAARATGSHWVYAGDVSVDLSLQVLSGSAPPPPREILRRLPYYNAVPAGASNVVVRAEVLGRTGGFLPGLRTSEDWDMWLRLARVAGQPACVERPLVALRIHRRMASRDARQILRDLDAIAIRHHVPLDRARHFRWAAWMSLEDGRRRDALRYYAAAICAGDWSSSARALVALLVPSVTGRRRASASDPWIREAQDWLDLLRPADR